MAEQIGYVVNTQTYILAEDADDANAKVKNGEGSVISRSATPKPKPSQSGIQTSGQFSRTTTQPV